MSLKIYNSLTNKLESFTTIKERILSLYVCGPTVYNYIHIGNARPIVFFDIVANYFRYLGFSVRYISNITDIDDKIIQKALDSGKTEIEIANFYTKAYLEDLTFLNSNKPDIMPKATEHISEIIDLINQLIAKGYAYNVDGNVYFRVNKLPKYGILSNQELDALKVGVRISNNSEKENSFDFTLWKKTDQGITFPSPFGNGRPGWHSECVVMSHKYGLDLDIHGGGMDLKFPHHENEIAQALALYNNTLANYWVHVGRVDLNGAKMSKSLGNSIFIRDFKELDEIMTIRLILAFSNYRQLIDYNTNLYNQYHDLYVKWDRALKQVHYYLLCKEVNSDTVLDAELELFKEYMNDDFNVQNVLTLLESLFKKLNIEFRAKELNLEALSTIYNTITTILNIFNLKFSVRSLSAREKEIYTSWLLAKEAKDFAKADQLRSTLLELNLL